MLEGILLALLKPSWLRDLDLRLLLLRRLLEARRLRLLEACWLWLLEARVLRLRLLLLLELLRLLSGEAGRLRLQASLREAGVLLLERWLGVGRLLLAILRLLLLLLSSELLRLAVLLLARPTTGAAAEI